MIDSHAPYWNTSIESSVPMRTNARFAVTSSGRGRFRLEATGTLDDPVGNTVT